MSVPVGPVSDSSQRLPSSATHRLSVLLVEIANFASLRRHVGRARSELLASDVAARMATVVPGAWAAIAARDRVELWFEGDDARLVQRNLNSARTAGEMPFDLDGETHHLHLVFGGSTASAHGADDVRLLENAEAALIEARVRHTSVLHDVGSVDNAQSLQTAIELGAALRNDEFLLQYQPKIHVRRQEIGSAEALVRWQHPVRGLVPPGDFIAVAEQYGLIGPMTLWILRRVIDDQRRLAAAGHDLRLFINISGQLLADPEFVAEACRLVAAADVPLGFEITETSVIRDPQTAIRNLQTFADIGIVIAIDDYGAGLSSLAYLKQLPARELKIDKLFITHISSSNRDPLIVRSTIDLAHALDMEVVAEGVETHAALALLTVMGCDMVQGFLISRPIALDALIIFLDEDRHRTTSQDNRASFKRLATAWKQG